jgi:hypothetical protein
MLTVEQAFVAMLGRIWIPTGGGCGGLERDDPRRAMGRRKELPCIIGDRVADFVAVRLGPVGPVLTVEETLFLTFLRIRIRCAVVPGRLSGYR